MDSSYNDSTWIKSVQTIAGGVIHALNKVPHHTPKVALIGHQKDQSSFYLKMLPQQESLEVDNIAGINATELRNILRAVTDAVV